MRIDPVEPSTNNPNIRDIREYFIDPENPNGSDTLAKMMTFAIGYLAHGSTDRSVESGSENYDGIYPVLLEILKRESTTRRFDTRFMGQIHPQGNIIALLGNMIGAYMNTNTIVKEVSVAEHEMELEVIDWLCGIFGYDQEASGNVVIGGTTANMAALWVARQAKFKSWNENGLSTKDRAKPMVLANSMCHYSIDKACDILGMSLVRLPVNSFKTDTHKLAETLANMSEKRLSQISAIVAVAGETETGLVDDLNAIADIAERHGIYLHVDAAYGGPFVLSKVASLFHGIDRADSITVDPHKMLYTPYTAGAVLFKDKRKHALIQQSARYLSPRSNEGVLGDPNNRNFGFAGRLEGSMSSSGVISTWATIKLFGKEGFAALLNHTLDITGYAYSRVLDSDYLKPIHQPELNTLLIGLDVGQDLANDKYNELLAVIQKRVDESDVGGYISINGEVDKGRSCFRYVGMHPFTTTEHVEAVICAIETEVKSILVL